jgi:hypothetical protein
MFSGSPIDQLLGGPLIDSVENTIALEKNHHHAFGAMKLWFTERPVRPRYPTGIYSSILIRREFMTFTLRNEEKKCQGTN